MLDEINKNEDEYYFEILSETSPGFPDQGAVRVFDGINEVWLPKAMIKVDRIKGRDAKIIVPDWLAKDRGFI